MSGQYIGDVDVSAVMQASGRRQYGVASLGAVVAAMIREPDREWRLTELAEATSLTKTVIRWVCEDLVAAGQGARRAQGTRPDGTPLVGLYRLTDAGREAYSPAAVGRGDDTAEASRVGTPALARCQMCPHKDTWAACICPYELRGVEPKERS